MLTRTDRILLELQKSPMTVAQAQSHFGWPEKEVRNALGNLVLHGRAAADRQGRTCTYRITETGRHRIEDLERSKSIPRTAIMERPREIAPKIELPTQKKEKVKPIRTGPLTRKEQILVRLLSGPKTAAAIAKAMGCEGVQAKKAVFSLLQDGHVSSEGPQSGKFYSLTGSGRLEAEALNQRIDPMPIVDQAKRNAPASVWAYAQGMAA